MEAIKDAIKNVMRDLEAKRQEAFTDDPQALLKQALTKKELKHIKFNYFRKGILNINVESSAWLYHLSLKKEELLARLSKQATGIRDIRFRLGGIK